MKDLKIVRRAVHLGVGKSIIAGYILTTQQAMLDFMIVFTLVLILLELIRKKMTHWNNSFFKKFRFLLKEHEHKKVTGGTFFLLGSLISIAVFSKEVAIMAIIFLTFGDVAASVVGKLFGNKQTKSFAGSFAFFFVSLFVGYLAIQWWVTMPFYVLVIGAIVGTLAENISFIDDNLTIPILSGIIMSLL